jgi:hypothetical protein
MNYDLSFWSKITLLHEQNGVRLFEKNGVYCVCPPNIEPGDAESFLRGQCLAGWAVFWQIVEEGKLTPNEITEVNVIQ